MEIYELLKTDHEKVKDLLNQLLSLEDDDVGGRRHFVTEIRNALVPHSRAEESVFYNSLRGLDSARSMVMHSYKEHLEAENLLRMLQVEDSTHLSWRSTAEKLKEALDHHISEEEGLLFEKARNAFTPQEAQMMGAAFEKLKPAIKEQGLAGTTWDLIANLMPPRFSDAFRKSSTPHL